MDIPDRLVHHPTEMMNLLETLSPNIQKLLSSYPQLINLGSPLWRMNNLYWIKDKEGKKILFKMNWAQQELWNDPHPCKIILKARQLGITTYFCLLHLDKVLFENNKQCGIIAHTREDASNIFKDKLKFAFDHLHPAIRAQFTLKGDSASELYFNHGSLIRVGTSLRSSTLQFLHISEFGKICATMPDKAREIVSGSLQTIHAGQSIVIESTAEGKEGKYHDLWQRAWDHKKSEKQFGPLDFKPFFFPWWKENTYTIGVPVPISQDLQDYFAKLELEGIKLSDPQKWWYAKKQEVLHEDINREYPSTPEEAFAASQDGYWYATQMKELHDAGHITNVSYDRAIPVHTAWDLGQADSMSIWFFQINRSNDINVIDFWQRNNTPLDQVSIILKSKQYNYGTHIWPHDAKARDRAGITFEQQARELGYSGLILEPHSIMDGINLVRSTLSRCWFDRNKCAEGIKLLENYQKRWSNALGGWTSEAVHNDASHCADSFRYLCAGIKRISTNGSLEQDFSALRKYWGS